MLDFILDSLYVTDSISDISFFKVLLSFFVALLLGMLVSFTYIKCSRPSRGFALSLVLLPTAVSAIILLVNGNLGMSIAVLGTFSLVRFRSAQGTAFDITVILIDTAAGIACGVGYVWLAAVVCVILCGVIFLLHLLKFAQDSCCEQDLKIVVPESMNFTGAFDDLFEKYTSGCSLLKSKTTAMGTLYELTYRVTMKKADMNRELIDGIRTRNGNLPVTLTLRMASGEEI